MILCFSQSNSTTHSLCPGRDIGLQRNDNRTFVTRSDCSRACRDPDLEEAARNNSLSVSFKFCFKVPAYGYHIKLVNKIDV